MDAFDPACAPGVCSPSRGGLSVREGLERVCTLTPLNIVAVDAATASPPHAINTMTAHLCAPVIYEMLVVLRREWGLDRPSQGARARRLAKGRVVRLS